MHPHIYKTTNGGKSWTEIVNGLPMDPINVVKEDPKRKGLLFAGSERAVYVSFDDGEHWQSLRLNMPATSIRDLVIKDDDLVVATHGRSFWILDNISSLRQLNTALTNSQAILYKPQVATRVRWNMNPDTPMPQEEPAGQNPPDGAIVDYYLNERAGDVRLEITDAKGNLIRRYTDKDTLYKIPEVNIPLYWIRPQQILSHDAGSHRFMWDLHYTPLNVPATYPIAATYMNTAPNETSPWVAPGMYTVKLTVDGKLSSFPLEVKMDPRVKTSMKDLLEIRDLALICYEGRKKSMDALDKIRDLRSQLKDRTPKASSIMAGKLNKMDITLAALEKTTKGSTEYGFDKLSNDFAGLFNLINETEMTPTAESKAAVANAKAQMELLFGKWMNVKNEQLKTLNDELRKEGMIALVL